MIGATYDRWLREVVYRTFRKNQIRQNGDSICCGDGKKPRNLLWFKDASILSTHYSILSRSCNCVPGPAQAFRQQGDISDCGKLD
jgi:hypothetical protein